MPDPIDPIVDLVDVSKRFGAVAALDHVDLTVRRGEILGVVGESGAGKSTFLDLLTGAHDATAGRVRVLGRDMATLGSAERRSLRRDLGVMFQSVDLLANRSVRRNVETPLRLRGIARIDRAAAGQRVEEMLRFVGLAERGEAYPAQLSGGQRQRVGIARALIARPRLLLCDEPTSSLDATTSAGVLGLLRDARDRLGTTIIIVTHDLDVVRDVCDRAALFERGRLTDVLDVPRPLGQDAPSYRERVRRALEA